MRAGAGSPIVIGVASLIARDGYDGNNDGIASKAGEASHVIHCQKSAALCGQGM